MLLPEMWWHKSSKINLGWLTPILEHFKTPHPIVNIYDSAGSWRKPSGTEHPGSPMPVTFALITLPACGHEILNLSYESRRALRHDKWSKMIPLCARVPAIRAIDLVKHTEYFEG